MGVTVGELEVIFQANTDQVVDAVDRVEKKIGGLKSKMDNVGKSGGALSVAAGSLIAGVVRGVVSMGGELVKDAVDISSYNERMKLSFGNVFEEQVKVQNSVVKYRQEGFKTITVTNGVAQLSSKVQKQLQGDIAKSAEAQSNLTTKTNNLAIAQYNLANKGPKKGQDPAEFALKGTGKWQGQVQSLTKDVADMQAVIANGAVANEKLAASQNAASSSYTKTVPNMVAYNETLLTQAQIAEKTKLMIDDAILTAENMAVHSPFNKEDVITSMNNLVGISNMSIEQAKKETQGLVDLAAARGRDGKQLQDFSSMYAMAAGTKRVYLKDLKATAMIIPDFMQKLATSMGVPIESLQKLSRKGAISFEQYNKIIQDEMEKAKGKAAEFSETLPGLIESIGDVKRNILQDFFAPILDGAKPALAAIVDVFTDPSTRKSFKDFGSSIGKGLQDGINTAGKVIVTTLKKLGLIGNDNPLIKRFLGDDKGLSKGTLDWVDKVSEKLTGLITFIRNNGETIKNVLLGIGAGIAALAVVGTVISTVTQIGVVLAALASPIGIISLLIAGAVLAWTTNFGGFRDLVTSVWDNIKGPLGQLWGAIQGIAGALQNGVGFKDAFTGAMSGLIKPEILSQFDPILGIPDKIKLAWEGKISISTLIGDVISGVSEVASNLVKNLVSGIGKNIRSSKTEEINASLKDLMTTALGKLADIVDLPENALNIQNFAKNIGTVLGGAIGIVISAFDNFFKEMGLLPGKVTDDQIKPGAETFMGNLGRLLGSLVKNIIPSLAQGISDGIATATLEGPDLALTYQYNASAAAAARIQGIKGFGNTLFGNKADFGSKAMVEEVYMTFRINPTLEFIKLSNLAPDIVNWAEKDIKEVFPTAIKTGDGSWHMGNPALVTQEIIKDYTVTTAKGPVSGPSVGPLVNPSDPFGFVKSVVPGVTQTSTTTGTLPSVSIAQPMTVTPTITATGVTSSTGVTTTVASVTDQVLKDQGLVPATSSALPTGVAAPGASSYSGAPVNVNVPVNVIPTYTSTTGTDKSPVDFVKTWAQSQGWVAEGGPNSYASQTGIEFHIPINIKPSAGSADAVTGSASGNAGGAGTAVGGMATLIQRWTESMGWTKEGNGYTAPIPITLHLPVIIDAKIDASGVNGSGDTGGAGGGTQSLGIADSIIKSLVDTFNGGAAGGAMFPIAAALGNMVKGAVNIAKINLGLNPISAEAPSYQIGKAIADSIGQALGDSLEAVQTKLDTIGAKLEDLRTKQIDPTAAAVTSMASATLIGFVGPKLDEFRNTYLIPLNDEFARLNSLLSSILTQLGLLGGAAQAAAGVNIPNIGGAGGGTGAPGAGAPPGGSNTNGNLPPGKGDGKNGNISFVVPVHIGDEKVSEKVYTYTKGKLVEEMNRYG